MLKQSLTQTCSCGQTMRFPEGEIKARCSCGIEWDLGLEGYWYTQTPIPSFAPVLARPVVCSVKSPTERYRNYPKSKHKKGRKAGRKCGKRS